MLISIDRGVEKGMIKDWDIVVSTATGISWA